MPWRLIAVLRDNSAVSVLRVNTVPMMISVRNTASRPVRRRSQGPKSKAHAGKCRHDDAAIGCEPVGARDQKALDDHVDEAGISEHPAQFAGAEWMPVPDEPRRQEKADLRQEHRVHEKEHNEKAEQAPRIAHGEHRVRQCRLGHPMLVERLGSRVIGRQQGDRGKNTDQRQGRCRPHRRGVAIVDEKAREGRADEQPGSDRSAGHAERLLASLTARCAQRRRRAPRRYCRT